MTVRECLGGLERGLRGMDGGERERELQGEGLVFLRVVLFSGDIRVRP